MLLSVLLAAALGLWFALALIFTMLAGSYLLQMERSLERAHRGAAADAALVLAPPLGARPGEVDTIAHSLRARHPDLVFVRLHLNDGRVITSSLESGYEDEPELLAVQERWGKVELGFDRSAAQRLAQTEQQVSLAAFAAIALGLLVLGLAAVAARERPSGSKGWNLTGEHDLIRGFGSTISTLRDQQEELRQLHGLEKRRADDLATITGALTRSLSSGFIALDPAGAVFDMNETARELLGLPSDRAVSGVDLQELIPDTPFSQLLTRSTQERRGIQRHEVAVGREGSTLVGLTTVPLFNEAELHLGTIALFTDLTPIRSLERRLREARVLAELGEIASGIAHEFRNSLGTILGYLKLARRTGLTPDSDKRVREAEREANQLSAAVDGLLAFARPIALHYQMVDLDEVARDVTARLAALHPEIRFLERLEPLTVEGDAALLARVIENLLRNSIESIHERGGGGTIEIGTDPSARRLAIRDDGIGFDPSELSRLMLPFQTSKAGGHGLGLPLARKIVSVHGGELSLNAREGAGAEADILFPSLKLDESGAAPRSAGDTFRHEL